MTIHLEIIADKNALYDRAVEVFKQELAKGSETFGLATGGTMLPLYEKLRESELDFSQCVSFNLDEYVGLAMTHPKSYRTFMDQQLFNKKPFAQSYLPNGEARNPKVEAASYEEKLQQLPLDFQLLGVGENGHIGFNEPGTAFDSVTHVVQLADSTRHANARFFDSLEGVPTEAITMGISSIFRARTILLIAIGEKKRAALTALMKGEQTLDMPVTALQQHGCVIVLTDVEI